MSEESVLAGLPVVAWDEQAMSRFEVVQELIGQVMAVYTEGITAEAAAEHPDQAAIERLAGLRAGAGAELRALRAADPHAVRRTGERYTELLRQLRAV